MKLSISWIRYVEILSEFKIISTTFVCLTSTKTQLFPPLDRLCYWSPLKCEPFFYYYYYLLEQLQQLKLNLDYITEYVSTHYNLHITYNQPSYSMLLTDKRTLTNQFRVTMTCNMTDTIENDTSTLFTRQ